MQAATEEEFTGLVRSSDYDFLMDCGVMKAPMMMQLSDKESVISAVCLHYSILGSLGELEQLKRGLQTAGLSALLEQHGSVMKDLFLHQDKKVTADFIQDLFEVEYSLLGSNYRFIEEAIIMNWLSYLKDLEGLCITIAKIVSLII